MSDLPAPTPASSSSARSSSSAPSSAAGSGRSGRSARDMALSLAVLLVPVVLLLIVYRLVFSGDAPIAVDAGDTWATARHSAHFTVLEPAGLPAKWTVISARFADGTLRVGYVTPGGAGLQLVESDQAPDNLLPTELGTDARPGDLVTIGARQWRVYPVAQHDNRALVQVDTGRTTIVIGTASDADLRTLAAALR